ncbi:hypothetical protein MMC07_009063 [Pseudocyphellaria aurata]|nr:hypothetical protein [Pseudocyphellaria aurata]
MSFVERPSLFSETFSFERIISSRIFEFVIGHEKTSFKIHSSAVALQSGVLNHLINGVMIEAQVGRVVWEDVNVETFTRFIHFAYLGDYPAPASAPLPRSTSSAVPPVPAAPPFTFLSSKTPEPPLETPQKVSKIDSWQDFLSSMNKAKQESAFKPPSRDFRDLNYSAHVPAMEFFKSCKPRSNYSFEDCTPVFIAHAQLYVFAEKYGISALKQITLHKLHKTLAIYTINPADISAIIELIRFTFYEDNTLDQENHVDDLRELVLAYVISEIRIIGKCEQFLLLIEDGGPFVKRIWLSLLATKSHKIETSPIA